MLCNGKPIANRRYSRVQLCATVVADLSTTFNQILYS